MSKADFHDRLQRIDVTNAQQHRPIVQGAYRAGRPEVRKPSYGLLGAGGAIMALGIQAVRFANENYEAIRNDTGIGAAVGLAVVGLATLLVGVVMIVRAVFKGRATPSTATAAQYAANVVQPLRQPSTPARIFLSLFGFAFGSIACLYMFMAVAARHIETETARQFSIGGMFIALVLVLVSVLFGLTALFVRGRALARVPIYFVFGGVLTHAAVRMFRINMLEWQALTAMLQ